MPHVQKENTESWRGVCCQPTGGLGARAVLYIYWGGWALLFEKTLQNVETESELEGLMEVEVEDFVGNISEE